MEIDCQPEESIVSSFDEDCAVLGGVKDMRLEAEAVVNDVLFAVSEMHVSQSLNCASDVAYINVETREGNRYCLELTEAGLRVRCMISDTQWFLTYACFSITDPADFDNKSFCQTGGGLCLQSSRRGFEHPVSRDCVLSS